MSKNKNKPRASNNTVSRESLCERMDALKGVRDATKIVVEAASAADNRIHNRLVETLRYLIRYGKRFVDVAELTVYLKHVAGANSPQLGYVSQLWVYWKNAPAICSYFVKGQVDESALRYGGASKATYRSKEGHVFSMFVEGIEVTRARFLDLNIGKLVKASARGVKVTRKDMISLLEAEVSGKATPDILEATRVESAAAAAAQFISLTLKGAPAAIDGDAKKLAIQSLELLASALGVEIASKGTKGTGKVHAVDAQKWNVIAEIAQKRAISDEKKLDQVQRELLLAATIASKFSSGELALRQPLAS